MNSLGLAAVTKEYYFLTNVLNLNVSLESSLVNTILLTKELLQLTELVIKVRPLDRLLMFMDIIIIRPSYVIISLCMYTI